MDPMPVGCLLNSMSRYLHLVSCRIIKFIPVQTCIGNIVLVLKLLRPVLDEVVDCKLPSDECLNRECEELDVAVNEAREFLENWSPKMSKFCSVFRCEMLWSRIQTCSLEICHILLQLAQSTPTTSSLSGVELCMQEIESLVKQYGLLTEHMEKALKIQEDDVISSDNHLENLVQALDLIPIHDLLKESIAVEKERINAEASKLKEKLDQAVKLVDLVSCIREYMLRTEFLEVASSVPVPPYFRCPLSMELMLDPVIVASGQTYDRTSIQKWLDSGLTVCPRTRKILTHNELIPNYTVKAMIASWLEANNIRLAGNSVQYDGEASSMATNMASHDIVRTESFRFSLRSSSFTSRSSLGIENGIEKLKINESASVCGDSNFARSKDLEIFARSSPEQSYTHSRCESICSAVSSVDYVPSVSNEVMSLPGNHGSFSGMSSKTKSESSSNGNHLHDAANTLASSEQILDGTVTITASHAMKLVEDLKSRSNEVKTAAAAEIRHVTKTNMENRIVIGHCGAIVYLLSLLYSEKWVTQEHAVTALLNLSINETNKAMIAEAGALEPLVHVLNTGNDRAKENSAATLFSLSVLQDYRAKIGQSNAVRALVNLLGTGTIRGKKDSASALFNLSIFHENKARIIQAGAVKYLIELLDLNSVMVDKAVALLANLSTVGEGRREIVKEGGVPLLVETVDSGSHRGKENAASVLLQLCLNSPKFCTLVLQEGAIPPLVALSQSGTPRAKEKAQQLLSHFRNQREAKMKKGRS
ncbi:PREDICTED: U-box domain-containing protein 3 [Tarenaya hassleriana]|uniref:U-box domain-containing protein 3 n=1 Tax=Tarenaya hassleriana TaxID=28532 RepID=UPI00053C6163|nr:PREDICTED: U-box domain-containing protein 3 [Tarenaya hassleriana]